MSTSDHPEKSTSAKTREDQIIDPRNLVYQGGSDRASRELIEDSAVTPEMVEQAADDIRYDLMPKQKKNEYLSQKAALFYRPMRAAYLLIVDLAPSYFCGRLPSNYLRR